MIWLVLVSLLWVSAANAEIKEGNFSVTLGALGYLSDGVQHQDFGPGVTAKIGYDFTKHFGLEGSFDYTLSKSSSYKGQTLIGGAVSASVWMPYTISCPTEDSCHISRVASDFSILTIYTRTRITPFP